MSTYKPVCWTDNLFMGALVFARWRREAGLMPTGKLCGFVWDTEDNGAIAEFSEEEKFYSRYFISLNQLEAGWHNFGMFYMQEDAKFIGLVPLRKYTEAAHVRVYSYFRRNKQRIPVWTQYYC